MIKKTRACSNTHDDVNANKKVEAFTNIDLDVSEQGELRLACPDKDSNLVAGWLLDAADGHFGQDGRGIGKLVWSLAKISNNVQGSPTPVRLTIKDFVPANTDDSRNWFIHWLFSILATSASRLDVAKSYPQCAMTCSPGCCYILECDRKKTCKKDPFDLTVDLEGVSDGKPRITNWPIGVTAKMFADAAGERTLSHVLAELDWEQLAALRECIDEAEQLKAATEMLKGKKFTVKNVNQLLSQTDVSFNNHEKKCLDLIVDYFEKRQKDLSWEEEGKSRRCRFDIQPRSDSSTIMFDIDARKEGGRRWMRAFLPVGLKIS